MNSRARARCLEGNDMGNFSWRTFAKEQDDDLVSTLARKQALNEASLRIAQASEGQRENRANEATRQDNADTNRVYREGLIEDRRTAEEARKTNMKRLDEQTAATVDAARQNMLRQNEQTAALDAIIMDPESPPELKKAAQLKKIGVSPSVNMTDPKGPVRVMSKAQALKAGEIDAGTRIVDEDGPGGNQGRPFFVPLAGSEGFKAFNTRTGTAGPVISDFRPPAGMADKIASGEASLHQLTRLREMFNPDWVGPAAGRYENVKLAVVGEQGQAGLAKFAAQVDTLKNQVIKDITGAQMSEPEAARILRQVPDLNNPPDVFMARLELTEENRKFLLDKQKELATGKKPATAPAAVAAPAGPRRIRYDAQGNEVK